jgi:hypothetical protein
MLSYEEILALMQEELEFTQACIESCEVHAHEMQLQEQQDQELAIQLAQQEKAVQLQVQCDLKLARQLSLQKEEDATDPKGRTYERLREMGLNINRTIANGSCMYDALRQVLQYEGILSPDATYKDVRRHVAEWLGQNKTQFAPDMFAPETRNNADGVDLSYMGNSMETICNNIATTDNWGCNAQLSAAAMCYGVGIKVYSTVGPKFDRLISPIHLKEDERYDGRIIRLLHISECHYEGVIKP